MPMQRRVMTIELFPFPFPFPFSLHYTNVIVFFFTEQGTGAGFVLGLYTFSDGVFHLMYHYGDWLVTGVWLLFFVFMAVSSHLFLF